MVDTRLSQFRAGPDAHSLTVGRNTKSNSVQFVDNSVENTKYLADAQFNSKLGILSIIKQNGDLLEIGGFLTQDQLGTGDRGERGVRGKDAHNGRDGKDGKQGDTGCQGEPGPAGIKGRHGRDGTDGPVGIPGKTGCEGPTGDPGQVGDKGDQGLKGELGKNGISCISGPIGPQGPKPRSYAYIGEDEPGPEYNIWAVPFVDEIPVLEDTDGITIVANNIDVTLVQSNGDKYSAIAAHIIEDIKGLKGNAEITWEGDYSTDSRIGSTVSANLRSLTLDALETISKGASKSITGKTTITVRDTYDDRTASKQLTYKFSGSNDQVVPQNLKGTAVDGSTLEGSTFAFTLNLDQAVENDVLVNLSFQGATTRMADSRSTSGVIKKGESSISFLKEIIFIDGIQDLDEIEGHFTASGVTEATTGSMVANLEIVESVDSTPVSINNKTFNETDSNKLYNFPLTLTAELSGSASVEYEIVDGTASLGSEFTSSYGRTRTLNFSTSFQTLNIPITVIGDNTNSGNKSFTIKFSNASSNLTLSKTEATVTIKEDDISVGGGGGCILLGTPVDTPDGPIKAELLAVGDEVTSRFIKGMPDASLGDEYNYWSTGKLEASPAVSRVEHVKVDTYHTLMTINKLMLTPDHPILIMREGRISWLSAGLIEEGDFMEKYGGWEKVTTVRMQTGKFDVVTLDVEPYDVYYANGILVHNAENTVIIKN